MKTSIVKAAFLACLALTAIGAMAQSTLGYGTIRQRVMTDSTGAPTLVGKPTVPYTPPPPVGGGLGTLAAVDLTFQTADGAGSVRYDCARGMGRLNATSPKTGAQLCPEGSGATNENWFSIASGGSDRF